MTASGVLRCSPLGGTFAAVSLMLLVLLSGCDDSRKRERAEKSRQERELFSDAERALPELERRLVQKVKTQNRLLVTSNEYLDGVQVFPLPATWKLSCSFLGMDIVLIYGSGEGDRTTVKLTDVSLTDDQCVRLAPSIAERLRSILQ
jgi:hypothetical protein